MEQDRLETFLGCFGWIIAFEQSSGGLVWLGITEGECVHFRLTTLQTLTGTQDERRDEVATRFFQRVSMARTSRCTGAMDVVDWSHCGIIEGNWQSLESSILQALTG